MYNKPTDNKNSRKGSKFKRMRKNDEGHRNQVETTRKTAATDENEVNPPAILRLNYDCFEEVADWLSLVDLHAFGQTCTRLQQVTGQIFKQNYSAARVEYRKNGIYIRDVQINGFCDYIGNMTVFGLDIWRPRDWYFADLNNFASLKCIELRSVILTDEIIACIKKILNKAEIVKIEGELYENLFEYCTAMKRLIVESLDYYIFDSSNDWLLQKYPTLEHFELQRPYVIQRKLNELEIFFKQNPNVRTFATDAFTLYSDWMNITGLKLDVLAVNCVNRSSWDASSALDQLSKMDFYNRLHLYSKGPLTNHLNRIEKLYFHGEFVDYAPVISVKELNIICDDQLLVKNVINNFVNLERVSLGSATLSQILAFIGGLEKLKKLRIKSFRIWDQPKEGIIDLLAWNNERKKLPQPRKVTIYVKESVFLATKWAIHQTRFSSIELKRDESYDWNHDFGFI